MTINDIADIAGNDGVHAISGSTPANARQLTLCASGGTARFGAKATVGAARGTLLPQNVPVVFHASQSDQIDTIDLTQAAVYVPTGTTLTISAGV